MLARSLEVFAVTYVGQRVSTSLSLAISTYILRVGPNAYPVLSMRADGGKEMFLFAGLFQLANLLRENTKGSIAISLLFAVAVLANWQAGSAWLSAQLGQRVCQVCTASHPSLTHVPCSFVCSTRVLPDASLFS
jgi:hypothetical protein